jgi:hypothetical protein
MRHARMLLDYITTLKSDIFWDITPCSPLKVNRRFGGWCRLHLQSSACHLLSRWFLALLILQTWKWRLYGAPKRRLTLNGLHSVISQKMILFITTAVITSNHTCNYSVWSSDMVVRHYLDSRLTDGGEVVNPTRRPPFDPRNNRGTHFC